MDLQSFPDGYRALVLGASGAIGAAFVQVLKADPRCAEVVGLHRQSAPPLDLDQEDSIGRAAAQLRAQRADGSRFHLIVHAAGILHAPDWGPEKKLADLNYAQLSATFRVNTFGPALVLRHFTPLLDNQRGVMVMLSAKVGSIGDNRLGGWYSYRASKAALNMLVKTAAIEIKRAQPQAIVVAMHPGTVNSNLSKPFRGAEIGRSPQTAATEMLAVIDKLSASDTGRFLSYNAETLPW